MTGLKHFKRDLRLVFLLQYIHFLYRYLSFTPHSSDTHTLDVNIFGLLKNKLIINLRTPPSESSYFYGVFQRKKTQRSISINEQSVNIPKTHLVYSF